MRAYYPSIKNTTCHFYIFFCLLIKQMKQSQDSCFYLTPVFTLNWANRPLVWTPLFKHIRGLIFSFSHISFVSLRCDCLKLQSWKKAYWGILVPDLQKHICKTMLYTMVWVKQFLIYYFWNNNIICQQSLQIWPDRPQYSPNSRRRTIDVNKCWFHKILTYMLKDLRVSWNEKACKVCSFLLSANATRSKHQLSL